MLQKQQTSPDSLSSAALPSRAASTQESTLSMHAELRGVVYLTPPTSKPSTSSNLSKTSIPSRLLSFKCHCTGVKVCALTALGWRCVRYGVSVCVSGTVSTYMPVLMSAQTSGYVFASLSARSSKEVSCHQSFNSALLSVTWRVQSHLLQLKLWW